MTKKIPNQQRQAIQRAAAHKAHATRKRNIITNLQKVADDLQDELDEVLTEIDNLSSMVSEHERNARREEGSYRDHKAAATRAARS